MFVTIVECVFASEHIKTNLKIVFFILEEEIHNKMKKLKKSWMRRILGSENNVHKKLVLVNVIIVTEIHLINCQCKNFKSAIKIRLDWYIITSTMMF